MCQQVGRQVVAACHLVLDRASAAIPPSHHQSVLRTGEFVDVVVGREIRGEVLARTIDFAAYSRCVSRVAGLFATPPSHYVLAHYNTDTMSW
jgi:hypothetical protein